MRKLLLSAFLLNSLNGIAGEPFITVGPESDQVCDYHSIQAAIDSGESDVIRIASGKIYEEDLTIESLSRSLIGGYPNCTLANANITDFSLASIKGSGNKRVIDIDNASGGSREFVLRNLQIYGGTTGVSVRSQGLGTETKATLNNLRIATNSFAGVFTTSFQNATAELIVNDSVIDLNAGSGLSCEGSNTSLKIAGDTLVHNNSTTGSGGGISAVEGCNLSVYSPTVISNNQADAEGAGIYAQNATVELMGFASGCDGGICFGTDDSPVTIEGNEVDLNNTSGRGGGIAIIGLSSSLTATNTLIKDNQANLGGGLSNSAANVTILGYESPGTPCWEKGKCSQILGNKATLGGALYGASTGTTSVQQTHISGNRADFGVVTHTTSGGSEIEILSSVIFENGNDGSGDYTDNYIFNTSSGQNFPTSTVILDYVTLSDNKSNLQVFANNNAKIETYSSILLHDNNIYTEGGVSPNEKFVCVLATENSSFASGIGGTVNVVDPSIDPLFVNPQAGNFHLLVDSPAIDYCYDPYGNASSDIDYDQRGIDNPDVDNFEGIFDIGADEFNINNDIIFMNGFEQD